MKKLSQVHAKFSAKGSNIDPNSACFVKVDVREEDFLAANREFKQNIANKYIDIFVTKIIQVQPYGVKFTRIKHIL